MFPLHAQISALPTENFPSPQPNPLYLCVVDRELRYTYVNRYVAQENGVPIEQHIGRPLQEVMPQVTPRIVSLIRGVLETGEPVTSREIEGRTLDGRPSGRQWMLDLYPLFDIKQEVDAVNIMVREVTHVKQMEAERRKGQEQLQLFAEASRIFASTLDYEQTLQQVAELLVPRYADWCALSVLDGEGVLQAAAVAHADPTRTPVVHDVHARYLALSEGQAQHQQLRHQGLLFRDVLGVDREQATPTAEQRSIAEQSNSRSAIMVPLRARNQFLGTLALIWDESERYYDAADFRFAEEIAQRAAIAIDNARLFREAREAEQKLRRLNESLEQRVAQRTAALERSNRELEEFAAVASHDLQEPLRKITAFGDRVAARIRHSDDPTALDYIERMQNAAQRMSGLIEDLLSLSRISTRGQAFDEVDLNQVMQNVLQDLEVRISERQAHITVEQLPILQADATQMRQLFQNLVANALRFRHPDVPPAVHIYAEKTVDAGATVYNLSVADNGIGFDEKYLDRIFQPFQRLHGRGEYRGTGMGLAICRKVVERHGGTITARSQPGAGATFIVTLPESQRAK